MLHLRFTPFPTLHTERLILRATTLEDAAETLEIRNHAIVNKYIHEREPLKSVEESKTRLARIIDNQAKNEVITWCICFKEKPEKQIGGIVFWNIEPEKHMAELGYELHPEHHNKGYMSEAMQKVLQYGKETMQLKKITAYTHQDNEASIKLLQNNGFQRDIALEKELIGKTEPETQTIHALIIK